MGKYIVNSFHIVIITFFLLVFSGCGYKASPIYVDSNSSIQKGK
jgi:hypothetical protein